MVTERRGRILAWCASCRDQDAVWGALMAGTGPVWRPATANTLKELPGYKLEWAKTLWDLAIPAGGTIVADYLMARRLPKDAYMPDALRFLARCPHPDRTRLPAMVAAIRNEAGQLTGIHRTFLRSDGSAKADVEPKRASLGKVLGGAIWLQPAAPEMVVGEGIETALSAGVLMGLPAWASLSAGNLANSMVLPRRVVSVVIAADHDDAGEQAARAAAQRWQREGRRVRIARPDVAGLDFNDLLRGPVDA